MPVDIESTLRVPIEVIEMIIDAVFQLFYDGVGLRDRYAIWKACSLTCRDMVPRSQSWIFRRVILSAQLPAERFEDILRSNPNVARYVRALTLVGPRKAQSPESSHWISRIPLIFTSQMVNLEELRLEGNVFRDCHPRFSASLSAFKSIRRLHLFNVSFSRLGQCTQLIRAFPRVRHLFFMDIKWKPDPVHFQLLNGGNQPSYLRRIRIEHLDLHGKHHGDNDSVHEFLRWFLASGGLQHLKTFHGMGMQFGLVQEYLKNGRTHLESIFLCHSHNSPIEVLSGNLDDLKTLHLECSKNDFPVQAMSSILLAAPGSLREITTYLHVAQKADKRQENTINEQDEKAFSQLDDALCAPLHKALRITVCLYGSGVSMESTEFWTQNLSQKLPKFTSNKEGLRVTRILSDVPITRWVDDRDGF